jgi:hypothetical protein
LSIGKGKIRLRFTSVVLLLVTLLCAYALREGQTKDYYVMADALDEVVAEVDGEELTVRDLAFYIAYEEQKVEQDAYVYNANDTGEYWRLHTNGTYIRAEGKSAAMQMAIHDTIFYQMAAETGIGLNEEEQKYLENSQYDFWNDLEEEQQEALAVGQDAINETMRKMALAEKFQNIYAAEQGLSYEEYNLGQEAYETLLADHDYQIIEKNWNRVHFGSITVNH